MHPRLPFLILPYTRAELPGWWRLMVASGVMAPVGDTRWHGAPTVVLRGKNHGFRMRLDLSDWAQRMTYFTGRYYEHALQGVLDLTLRQGDRFVDIGANIGMITLHARSLVGSSGTIDCFEPNPVCIAAIKTNLGLNGIENVVVHGCALSDQAGELLLNFSSEYSGTATLAKVENAFKTIPVDVRVGDDVLLSGRPVGVMKIDVEGFELNVLTGLKRTLEAFKPIVITELIEAQLAKADASVEQISKYLTGLGYRPFGIGSVRKGLVREVVLLRETHGSSDAVWVHADHKRSSVLMGCVQ